MTEKLREKLDEVYLGEVLSSYLIQDNYRRVTTLQSLIAKVAANRRIPYSEAVNAIYIKLVSLLGDNGLMPRKREALKPVAISVGVILKSLDEAEANG